MISGARASKQKETYPIIKVDYKVFFVCFFLTGGSFKQNTFLKKKNYFFLDFGGKKLRV